MLNKSIKFLIENKIVAVLLLTMFIGWGVMVAPFDWDTGSFPRNPVAVDAIPDIGGIHNSAFVNTYIPNENEPHVTVTQESADFALEEIRNPVLEITEHGLSDKYFLVKNPVSHEIRIKLNADLTYDNVELAGYNISGQQLFLREIQNPNREISIAHSLSAGIYLLNIQDTEGSYTLKFVVK